MGRGMIYAILIIALLLPVCFSSSAEAGFDYRHISDSYSDVKKGLSEIKGWFGEWLDIITNVKAGIQIRDYAHVHDYDSAGLPQARANSYFAGTEPGQVDDFVVNSWTDLNKAKEEYELALVECPTLYPTCYEHLQKVITYMENGNNRAVAAAETAQVDLDEKIAELEKKGGDLAEYGSMPFETYTQFMEEFEKQNGKYSKFKWGLQSYGKIDVSGEFSVECNTDKLIGGKYLGFMLMAFPIGQLGMLSCIDVKHVLPRQYSDAYNKLIGEQDGSSGVLSILRAKEEFRRAIAFMENDYNTTNADLVSYSADFDLLIDEIQTNKLANIDYDKVESVVGSLPQDVENLLILAKESKAAVDRNTKEANRIYDLKRDNYLANATMMKKSAVDSAKHSIDLLETAKEIVSEARGKLDAKCDELSKEARAASVENGLFSVSYVIDAAAKCDSAAAAETDAGAIEIYLDAIAELQFLKSGLGEEAELADEEILKLEIMIKKAREDFSVDEEDWQLTKARRYLNGELPAENQAELYAKAYRIAIDAQNSIWNKADNFFGRLVEERIEADSLIGKVGEVNEKRTIEEYAETRRLFDRAETKYSGKINLDSLGHLKETSEVYEKIRALASYLNPEELLVMSTTSLVNGVARCNEVMNVHYTTSVWNPYSFEVGSVGPNEEKVESYDGTDVLLECGPLEEKVLWIYADKEERVATRQITPVQTLENAVIEFELDEVLTVLSMGAESTSTGISKELAWPVEGIVGVEYMTTSSMEVYGPACETEGEKEKCRYVLSIQCGQLQQTNVLLERPIELFDEVWSSVGDVKNIGRGGIIIENADCPGHITVDVSYVQLEEDSEALLDKIEYELGKLEGIRKDDLTKRYEALKEKSPREVISRGGKLLDEIEEAIIKQEKDRMDESTQMALRAEKAALENWLKERGFEIPLLSPDYKEAIKKLADEKSGALMELSGEYQEIRDRTNELVTQQRLIKKFGIDVEKVSELEQRLKQTEKKDEYFEFAKAKGVLRELIKESEQQIKSVTKEVVFSDVADSFSKEEELTKACDQEVDVKEPQFLMKNEYCEKVFNEFGKIVELKARGEKLNGGDIEGLIALDKEEIYPNVLKEDYEKLVESTTKKMSKAREVVETEIRSAEELFGEQEGLLLAKQSLAKGYINRAYAYAIDAQKNEKGPGTGLITLQNSMMFLAPLLLLGAIWQLRKKKKIETPVQRAIRISS